VQVVTTNVILFLDEKHGSRIPANHDGTGSVSNIDLYCEMQRQPGGGLTIEQSGNYGSFFLLHKTEIFVPVEILASHLDQLNPTI